MPKFDPKLILAANQKEIKKNVEKLYDLASELKAEVEKTDSVLVLSVAMLRRPTKSKKLAKRSGLEPKDEPAGDPLRRECALAPANHTG